MCVRPITTHLIGIYIGLPFPGRSCVGYYGGSQCQDGDKEGRKVTICKEYCQEDGCNHAPPPAPTATMTIAAALLGAAAALLAY